MKPLWASQILRRASIHLRRERQRVLGYPQWWHKRPHPTWTEAYDYGWRDAADEVQKLLLAAGEDLRYPVCLEEADGVKDLREHLATEHTAGELADLLTGYE